MPGDTAIQGEPGPTNFEVLNPAFQVAELMDGEGEGEGEGGVGSAVDNEWHGPGDEMVDVDQEAPSDSE